MRLTWEVSGIDLLAPGVDQQAAAVGEDQAVEGHLSGGEALGEPEVQVDADLGAVAAVGRGAG